MVNRIIRIIVFLSFIVIMALLMNKDLVVTVLDVNNDLVFEYCDTVYTKDLVKLKNAVLKDTVLLDTFSLGEKSITINYKNNKENYKYTIEYKVVDKTSPVIMGGNTITISKGDKSDIALKLLCGDNYDKRPKCTIEGDYDINKTGEYNVKYIASDSSNNITEKDIKIIVKSNNKTSYADTTDIPVKDLIAEHKKDDTMIGIDVSDWQGNIDWKKVKEAGIEFAIIRIGYGYTVKDNVIKYDDKFKLNLKNAKEAGILVGLYFYSYAHNEKEAIEQAKWIVDSLDGEELDLPIAFDWEIWSKFNSYNISITDLNKIAKSFIDEVEKNGYEGMLYGSCSYLERIWNLPTHKTWLAHYAKETDYTKNYYIWQLTNAGKVDGIKGYVDLNILYK